MGELRAPNGQQACSGVYNLVVGQTANGHPLWKHNTDDFWLYSGHTNRWCIGGKDVEQDQFRRSSGFLLQTLPHSDNMPNKVASIWQRWDPASASFFKDPDISIDVSRS